MNTISDTIAVRLLMWQRDRPQQEYGQALTALAWAVDGCEAPGVALPGGCATAQALLAALESAPARFGWRRVPHAGPRGEALPVDHPDPTQATLPRGALLFFQRVGHVQAPPDLPYDPGAVALLAASGAHLLADNARPFTPWWRERLIAAFLPIDAAPQAPTARRARR